jgi:AcrR family transcriptional regulator
LFAKRGLDAPLDDIAKRSGLSNATLYRHFPDRRSLIIEVVLGNLERHEQALASALGRDRGWTGLCEFLDWLFTQQVNEVNHLAALRAIPAGQNQRVDRLRQHTLSAFEKLIDRAKAEGDMRADRWAEDIFLLLFVNEQLTGLADTPTPEASHRLLRLALDALASTAPASRPTARPPNRTKSTCCAVRSATTSPAFPAATSERGGSPATNRGRAGKSVHRSRGRPNRASPR